MLTVGVEEEFLLLEPGGGVAPAAPGILALTAGDPQITPELMTYQIETASAVCTELDDLRAELTRLRGRVAEAAEQLGVRLVASGLPPFGSPGLDMLTHEKRYLELSGRFPAATTGGGTCACHVHIGMADRDVAVGVLGRLRPWLPALMAMTGNSPLTDGVESGWSSGRYRRQLNWPTFRPPRVWRDAASYDRSVSSLVRRGVALDPRSVYFLARLSPRYPTIEIRIADTCLTTEDAVLLAAVVRGLVAALVEDVQRGRPPATMSGPSLRARLLAAAHHGSTAPVVRPRAVPSALPVEPAVARLHERIMPALEASGEADEVRRGLERLVRTGTGTQRQLALRAASRSPAAFVAALADATAAGTRPSERCASAKPGPTS